VQLHRTVEEFGGFPSGKAQVAPAQFRDLLAGAQPGQRPRGIDPCGEDEVKVGRLVFEEEEQVFVDRRRFEQVIIVQD